MIKYLFFTGICLFCLSANSTENSEKNHIIKLDFSNLMTCLWSVNIPSFDKKYLLTIDFMEYDMGESSSIRLYDFTNSQYPEQAFAVLAFGDDTPHTYDERAGTKTFNALKSKIKFELNIKNSAENNKLNFKTDGIKFEGTQLEVEPFQLKSIKFHGCGA